MIRGWANYFRIANCKTVFARLMEWIRRRLRMKKMKEWKSWGYRGEFKKISMRR
ncbi:group II intron maturase-specific domain-containing protein [Anoxybacter fermentans]|uniref:group II intron maturase-specific domain-containing protein n=1 Tax=Anoxybacter fermentans TaxID=1323375 RepID=UPI00196A5EC6